MASGNIIEFVLLTKEQASAGIDKVRDAFKNVVAPVAAATAAVAGAAAGLVLFVDRQAAAQDMLQKLSERLGLPVDDLSRLKHAADLSGLSIEELGVSMRFAGKNISDAAAGSKTAQDTLRDLGLEAANLRQLSPSAQLDAIADALGKIRDPGDRARLAMELFGRSGTAMLPMLKDGSAGLQAMKDDADALGLTLSKAGGLQAAAFNDEMTRLKGALAGLAQTTSQGLMPVLQPAITDLTQAIVDNRKAIAAWSGAVGTWVNGLAQLLMGTLRARTGIASLALRYWETIEAIDTLGGLVKGNERILARRQAAEEALVKAVQAQNVEEERQAAAQEKRQKLLEQATEATEEEAKATEQLAERAAVLRSTLAQLDDSVMELTDEQLMKLGEGLRDITTGSDDTTDSLEAARQAVLNLAQGDAVEVLTDAMREARDATRAEELALLDLATGLVDTKTVAQALGAVDFEAWRTQLEMVSESVRSLDLAMDDVNAGNVTMAQALAALPALAQEAADALTPAQEALRRSLGVEMMQDEFAKRRALIDIQYARELEMAKGNATLIEAARQVHALRMNAIAQEEANARVAISGNLVGALAALAATGGRRSFRLYKALATSEAIISTYLAVTKALASAPPPWSYVAAAAAMTYGMAQVVRIVQQRPPPAAHGGLDFVPAEQTFLLQRGERVLSPAQNRELTGFLDRQRGSGGAPAGGRTIHIDRIEISHPDSEAIVRKLARELEELNRLGQFRIQVSR